MRYLCLFIVLISLSVTGQQQAGVDTANGYWQQLKRFIHHSIFVPEHKRKINDTPDFKKGEEKFKTYRNTRIRDIHIIQVDLLAGSVVDTNITADAGIAKLLNKLHFTTHESVIRNNVLFKENDLVDPFELADTERILRRLSFIEDANIIILPLDDKEYVDCIIVVQDKFSIGFSYDPITSTKHKFKLYDRNLFGYGFEFTNTFIYHSDNDLPLEYDSQIYLHNIQGTFIAAQLNYRQNQNENAYTARFSKGFITPKIKYAGGLDLGIISEFNNQIQTHTYELQDQWVGRSFQIDADTSRKNIIIAARIGQKKYSHRPRIFPDSNYTYHNYQLALGSLTYRKINYLQTSMLFSFGATEDIPYGYLINVTAGIKEEEFYSKPYLGTTIGFSDYLKNIGYFGFRTDFGTYRYQGDFIQTVLRNNFSYFTALYAFNNYHLRTIFSTTYSVTSRQLPHENFSLDTNIRHFSNPEVRGRQRAVLTLEPVIFTPWNLVGFKFALFAFGDLGFISNDRFLFSKKNRFGSLGFGFRIRNESLVFNTMEIRFAYLHAPKGYDTGWRFHYTSSDPTYMKTVQFSRPEFITYQ